MTNPSDCPIWMPRATRRSPRTTTGTRCSSAYQLDAAARRWTTRWPCRATRARAVRSSVLAIRRSLGGVVTCVGFAALRDASRSTTPSSETRDVPARRSTLFRNVLPVRNANRIRPNIVVPVFQMFQYPHVPQRPARRVNSLKASTEGVQDSTRPGTTGTLEHMRFKVGKSRSSLRGCSGTAKPLALVVDRGAPRWNMRSMTSPTRLRSPRAAGQRYGPDAPWKSTTPSGPASLNDVPRPGSASTPGHYPRARPSPHRCDSTIPPADAGCARRSSPPVEHAAEPDRADTAGARGHAKRAAGARAHGHRSARESSST